MFCQTDRPSPLDFQHYACLFSTLLSARPFLGGPDWTLAEGVDAWIRARKAGFITGDLNDDGDFDDEGEDEIAHYQGLFDFLGLPLRVVPPESLGLPMGPDRKGVQRILPFTEPLAMSRYFILEAWHWRITHFVHGTGMGKRPVIYDPIRGGSLTVKNGRCESLRIFEIKATV